MVQEESTTEETPKASSSKKKVAKASKYDAVQESDPSVLTVYKFISRFGENDGAKEYKVAAESLHSAARLVNIKADSVTQTGVESYSIE